MGIDRESAVRKAEELVRDGKIDLAIDEYTRLVDDLPGDVGAANALGDLYVKVGNRAAAVAQFNQIGDTQRDSGFIPKAVAFYKKALKVDPASDHALSRLAQVAIDQELFADATLYLNRLLQRRRELNNEAGVAECVVRIGSLPTATADAKLAAARASATHFAPDQTARLWIEAGDALERSARPGDAVDALMQASALDPDDTSLRRRVALACATAGMLDRARAFLSFETAADHPDLLLMLAEHALAEGRDDEARRALERVIAVAPDRRAEADALLAPLVAPHEPSPPVPESPTGVVAEAQVQAEVEVSFDDGPLDIATAFGSGSDDAELAGEGAMAAEGDAAPSEDDAAPAGDAPAGGMDWAALLGDAGGADPAPEEPIDPDDPAEPVVIDEEEYGVVSVATDAVYVEPDEPAAVAEYGVVEPVPGAPVDVEAEPEAVVTVEEAVEEAPEPAPEPVSASSVAQTASDADLESIRALTAAAQNPALQFQASAQLGRLLLKIGRAREGIDWLERATQAATPVREQRLDVMYELADALERAGERARALDVFADLEFDAASYRDVPERMTALRRALEEGRAT